VLVHHVMLLAVSSCSASGNAAIATSCNNFMSSTLGTTIQSFTRVLAFPFFVIATVMIFRRVWKKRHSEAALIFVLVCFAFACMLDLSILAAVASFGATIGQAIASALASL